MKTGVCDGASCFYCGGDSTHFCSGCGNCVCNSPICNGLATIAAAKRGAAGVVSAVRRVVNSPSAPGPSNGRPPGRWN